jgi:hypothetical protein
MDDLTLQVIKIEMESINLKKQLIAEYSKFTSDITQAVCQVIVNDSRASIRQSQLTIQFLSKPQNPNP